MEYLAPLQARKNLPGQLTGQRLEAIGKQLDSSKTTEKELKALSQQFESIFINQLLTTMRATVPQSGLLKSYSLDTYQQLLDQEIANEISQGRGIGLADMMFRDLIRLQAKAEGRETEKSSGPASPATNPFEVKP